MNSSADSFIDDVAAYTTVEHYGNISIVDIPGSSTLSELQRIAIFKKAEPRHTATPHNALLSRLRCMTPPLDEEEENEESRLLEEQARRELETDGCPPCYPPDLDIPLRNPPRRYEQIIWYWQSFTGIGDVVLCAQLSDWRKFRASQLRVRRRFRDKHFSEYVNQVRERRQRHELGGDVHLLLDPKQQTRLEDWVEFQNYHLHGLERFGRQRDELKRELDEVRGKVRDANLKVSERVTQDAEAIQQLLEDAKRDLERHKGFLHWIEQERRVVDLRYPTPIKEVDQDAMLKIVRRISTRNRRKGRPTASILGKVRVSKATPTKQNKQMQKIKALDFEPVIRDLHANPQSNTPPAPKRRETKCRETKCRATKKQTPLQVLRPKRVCKAKRSANASAKSLGGTHCCEAVQIRSPERAGYRCRLGPQRSQPACENFATRSGRQSRPPVRWAPG